jgi:hypothetical protein
MGFENFIKIIKNKRHPERQSMLDWAEKDTRGYIIEISIQR